MMMYDDLIKQLCYCADATTCRNCLWKTDYCPTDMQKKAADVIEELRKAVLRLEDESGIYDELPTFCIYPTKWIPVTERLPEVGKKVLVFAYGHDVLTARMQKRTEFGYPMFECNGTFLEIAKLGRITHWMPLPEPPKEGE